MDRRLFLHLSGAGAMLAGLPGAMPGLAAPPPDANWDRGQLLHLLPTVSDREILIKASFAAPLTVAPTLRVGGRVGALAVPGQMSDSRSEMWQFHARGLNPGRRYQLALMAGGRAGRPLCQPWELATFPAPDARPERARVLFFTCAGGHDALGFLPATWRNRLLRRALSFQPDAAIANGDHVYWDLRSPLTSGRLGASSEARQIAGQPDRAAAILGADNETFLKRAATPQIVPVYGTDFRSTPVFFIQDDHDYFENDDAYDEIVTFPADHFMTQMARATQSLYYPEFLPDTTRPAGLPGASSAGRALPVSESFGTLRYGQLLEVLLYTVRRTMTMAGPGAVFLEDTIEAWLKARMAASGVAHVVNAPSNPPGWTAGKWGEWYPDVLGADGKLTVAKAKPYWQPGWAKQHDRLLAAMSAMRERVPLVISGDLHACALGRIQQTGTTELMANPVVAVLSGPIGTGERGWPSNVRKIGPQPSLHLRVEEQVKPIEQHGFTLADFTPEKVTLRLFKWDVRTQAPEAMDTLEPFHTVVLARPA
ncbi:MAG: alkaline phosphatase D family protein [Blastocatellia bacterium]